MSISRAKGLTQKTIVLWIITREPNSLALRSFETNYHSYQQLKGFGSLLAHSDSVKFAPAIFFLARRPVGT